MLKSISKLTLLALLLSSPLFAAPHTALMKNACLREIDPNYEGDKLNLMNCNLVDEDMGDLLNILNAHPKVKYLDIAFNNIGPQGAIIFDCFDVEILDASYNHIGEQGAAALAHNYSIKVLSLYGNNLTTKAYEILSSSKTLQYLMTDKVSNHAVMALAKSKSLKGVSLGEVHLNDATAQTLAANKNFKVLYFNDSRISKNQLKLIMKMPALELFGMDSSQLGEDKINIIATNSNLVYLYITNNKITRESARAIASMPGLLSLSLRSDEIDDYTVANLSQNPRILVLDLYNNKLTSQGATYLANSAAAYFALDVSFNHIGPVGLAALKAKHILNLYMDGNDGKTFKNDKNYILREMIHVYRKGTV